MGALGPLLALTTALTTTCVGQLPGPAVCNPDQLCGEGNSCVLGRCRPPTEQVASSRSSRQVLEVAELAVVTGRSEQGAVPQVLELGGDELADGMVLMRFPLAPLRNARLERAVLELTAAAPCGAMPTQLELSLRPLLGEWSADTIRRSRMPELGLPLYAGRHSTSPPRPLRLDVTELVLGWLEHPRRHHGLVLEAARRGPPGAGCFGSGTGTFAGPTLTLYLNSEPDPAPTDGGLGDSGAARDGGGGEPPGNGGAGGEGGEDLAQD